MDLTAVDQTVLLAVFRLKPDGYGVGIQREIAAVTGRNPPPLGTIYAALERLQNKGYVTSREGEPTEERGGRRKLHFEMTAPGQQALKESLRSIDLLRAGQRLGEAAT